MNTFTNRRWADVLIGFSIMLAMVLTSVLLEVIVR